MTERWRRELRRLDESSPSKELLTRARRGPTMDLPEPRPAPRGVVVLVAFAVFTASGVLVWRALEPGSATNDRPPIGVDVPTCDPVAPREQLQGDDFPEAMGEVMGAISQGRMCEFWSVMLLPDVQAEHPWPAFADEWRAWLLQQDFSDAESSSNWLMGPLHWELWTSPDDTDDTWNAEPYVVDVVHNGERIATLKLVPDVVPFWGVVSWQFDPPPRPAPPATDATTEWPSGGASLPFASVDEALEFIRRNLDTEVALPTWLPPGVDLRGGASVYAGSLGERRSAQLTLPLSDGGSLGVQYGVSALDGCAPEESVPVRIAGQPGRLRYLPEYPWSELIWPATLAHPTGVYGLNGPFSDREILAIARSMPQVTGRVVVELDC